ncbi:MAG: threonine--tRNA ligase [Acidobacteriota bacterium]|jgi:threonyl-tRNA synthetase|nr:threonine--tRNA ligase [Acidobacteriota bacterium]
MSLKVRHSDGKESEINESTSALEIYRHSTSHLMAAAILELFPGTHLGIGPAISDGFYYDFERPDSFTEDDLKKIEEKMSELAARDLPFVPSVISKAEAIAEFSARGEHLKVELIEEKAGETLSTYQLGALTDFCLGPHLCSTGQIQPGSFKLTSVAGSYWRGDEHRQQLQRIYGAAFLTAGELTEYLNQLEEAKKRDHRKLGRELDLFSMSDEAGQGLAFWHPKGTRVRVKIEEFLRAELFRRGYEFVTTPHIGRDTLWKKSGHYDYYKQNMYLFKIDDEEFVLKPMNCPGHILIYKSQMRSYRELPLRFAEFGTVYRYEKSGVLHGLLRVRGFTQDDAHIFCTRDQVKAEIADAMDLVLLIMKSFGFAEFKVELSVRDSSNKKNYAGTEEDWELAESALMEALKERGIGWKRMEGEAVFYGPKIDVKLIDAIGRSWQLSTIQFDFTLPKRFDLSYVGSDGQNHQPVMVHRALLGSIERFLGVLIEHYAGAFPIWLAPVQAVIIPIAERHHEYAKTVLAKLAAADIRVELDDRNEKMGYKIRAAQTQKIPYMLVIGDKEVEAGTVSVRNRFQGDEGALPLDGFLEKIEGFIKERTVKP